MPSPKSTGLPAKILDNHELNRLLKNDQVRAAFPQLASVQLPTAGCCTEKAEKEGAVLNQVRQLIGSMSAADKKLKDTLKVGELHLRWRDAKNRPRDEFF